MDIAVYMLILLSSNNISIVPGISIIKYCGKSETSVPAGVEFDQHAALKINSAEVLSIDNQCRCNHRCSKYETNQTESYESLQK